MRRKKEIITLSNLNFYYYFDDYSYNTEHDCFEYGCDGICRCGRIVNEKINKVNYNSIYTKIVDYCSKYNKDKSITQEIDLYGIDRILRFHKVYDTDIWYIKVGNGYYGEEIQGIYIEYPSDIEKRLVDFFSCLNISKKVEYLLNMEYGYLLDNIKDCVWKIKTVNVDNIKINNHFYFKKVSNDFTYNDYDGILGITRKEENNYILIDGFHRMSCNKKDKVKIIYCEKGN